MKTTAASPGGHRLRTLDDYLASSDIAEIPTLTDHEWDTLRHGRSRLFWRFCTLRNLWVHRGRFFYDGLGFAWGGIYRTLLVGSIVSTSYRNERLFRAGMRIQSTGDFFRGGFMLPRSSANRGVRAGPSIVASLWPSWSSCW
jgi:hypothetical protein